MKDGHCHPQTEKKSTNLSGALLPTEDIMKIGLVQCQSCPTRFCCCFSKICDIYPFIRGSKLQDLCDRSQVPSLVICQAFVGSNVNDVKGVRRHNCRVYITVVDQVSHNLKSI